MTDMKAFSDLISNSSALTPQEKQTATAYLMTNPTPASSITAGVQRAHIFVGPRWAQIKLNQTALDLRIAKEFGQLPTAELDRLGLLGPLLGRGVEFAEGKVGTSTNPVIDKKYADFRTSIKLMASGMARTHFGSSAGVEAQKYFNDLIGGAFRSKQALYGEFDSIGRQLGTYASAVQGFGQGVNIGGYELPPIPGVPGAGENAPAPRSLASPSAKKPPATRSLAKKHYTFDPATGGLK
jgi:hypothetical protein